MMLRGKSLQCSSKWGVAAVEVHLEVVGEGVAAVGVRPEVGGQLMEYEGAG